MHGFSLGFALIRDDLHCFHVDVCRFAWICIDLILDLQRFQWISYDLHGPLWFSIDFDGVGRISDGFVRICIDLYSFLYMTKNLHEF